MTPRPTPRELDPSIQAIFTAMLDYMGTIYPVVTTSGTYDGSGITLSINCQDYPGNRWEYREYTRGPRVTVTPIF